MTQPSGEDLRKAREIVAKLYVPDDPREWGESPVSVPELETLIAAALVQAREEGRREGLADAGGAIECMLPPRGRDPQDNFDRMVDVVRRSDLDAIRALATPTADSPPPSLP